LKDLRYRENEHVNIFEEQKVQLLDRREFLRNVAPPDLHVVLTRLSDVLTAALTWTYKYLHNKPPKSARVVYGYTLVSFILQHPVHLATTSKSMLCEFNKLGPFFVSTFYKDSNNAVSKNWPPLPFEMQQI